MKTTPTPVGPAPVRSSFVTRVGWVFIAVSSLSMAVTATQLLIAVFAFEAPLGAQVGSMPRPVGAMLTVAAVFVASASSCYISIGFLRRRRWGWRAFLALLAFGIVLNAGAFVSQLTVVPSLDATEGPADYLAVLRVIEVFSLLYPVAIAAILTWLWIRLSRVAIRAEFHAASALFD